MKRKLIVLLLAFGFGRQIFALGPGDLKQVQFDQKIGQQISRGLIFRDSDGSTSTLIARLGNKPTLLIFGYYHCPMLCTLINDGLINALQQLRLDVGKDFNVIEVSIDPRETPALAAVKKIQYLKRYGRRGAAAGWHFLTADEATIKQLTSEAGFHFVRDPEANEFAHPSGVIVLTPGGLISRYFLGVNIDPHELDDSIRAASRGESGSVIQRLVLLCYHYNPITGKYGRTILSILRLAGVATVVLIGLSIVYLSRGRAQTTHS